VPDDPITKLLKSEDVRAKLYLVAWIAQFCALIGIVVGFIFFILIAFKII
jgi:hypothetical protein